MEQLYAWVRNITFYMILVSVIQNLLPTKKYEKYLHLFLGMVLILLVIQPLTGSLRLEERIAYYFSRINLRNQAGDLEKEFLGAEQDRLDRMVDQYEEAVAMDLEQMARDAGFYPIACSAKIGRMPEAEDFGKVKGVRLVVSTSYPADSPDGGWTGEAGKSARAGIAGRTGGAGAGTEESIGGEDGGRVGNRSGEAGVVSVSPVEPVRIGADDAGKEGETWQSQLSQPQPQQQQPQPQQQQPQSQQQQPQSQQQQPRPQQEYPDGESQDKLRALRRKIVEYYSLEEDYVEIQLENG